MNKKQGALVTELHAVIPMENSIRVTGHATVLWTGYSRIARSRGREFNPATSLLPWHASMESLP